MKLKIFLRLKKLQLNSIGKKIYSYDNNNLIIKKFNVKISYNINGYN